MQFHYLVNNYSALTEVVTLLPIRNVVLLNGLSILQLVVHIEKPEVKKTFKLYRSSKGIHILSEQ